MGKLKFLFIGAPTLSEFLFLMLFEFDSISYSTKLSFKIFFFDSEIVFRNDNNVLLSLLNSATLPLTLSKCLSLLAFLMF